MRHRLQSTKLQKIDELATWLFSGFGLHLYVKIYVIIL